MLLKKLYNQNYTKLNEAYSSKGRKLAVEPETMFKILTYAYSQNIYSGRDIEKACKRDINFKWLLAGQNAPDHTTISRFRKKYLSDNIVDDINLKELTNSNIEKEDLIYSIENILKWLE